MRSPVSISLIALAAVLAPLVAGPQDPPPPERGGGDAQQVPAVPDGFAVPAGVLVLRARALDTDLEYARPALAELGKTAMDRVTVELLMALARGRDEARRNAAADALLGIAGRAAEAAQREFAGGIAETLYLSSLPLDLRERAYPLFMLLDTESARRHRRKEG